MAKCELYQDVKDQWRWRRLSAAGKIEAFSKQGFESSEEAEKDGKDCGECSGYNKKEM
ncbi:MAG: hypothetical protein BalsKO_22250 [Balneolaceae bacterium]